MAAWSAGLQQVLSLLGLWAGSPHEQLVHMQHLALARYAQLGAIHVAWRANPDLRVGWLSLQLQPRCLMCSAQPRQQLTCSLGRLPP